MASAVQLLGLALLAAGMAVGFGWPAGLMCAGAGLLLVGIAMEGGNDA